MEPWYKTATPREEVRAGRSFNPDEFAIALEQVVAGTAPADYCDPAQFFARTCWTKALREQAGLVLRRLAGITEGSAPVLTLITQFGGGKTHTLTALYHLCRAGRKAVEYEGVRELLVEAGLSAVPEARVAVFVGNAWDPQEGRETPWIDIARQLAGDKGVELLGKSAAATPPGTEALGRVFAAANAPVLILFDEVLNFLNRHRGMAEPFHAFIQNLTVAMTGTTHGAAVISLPRSQVEMTDWDVEWQEKISRVVRRVAKDLIVNEEAEISEVVRRRLFEDLGSERVRKNVAKAYADWCFERRAQLPPEWTAVDTAATEAKAREYLRKRFEACYPFHPATLSVFQRKWQTLSQYQQTRGTLAMLAQWIAHSYREGFTKARREPLLTLGSAPLDDHGFRSTILGQLGEPRLEAAIEVDIAGEHSHARALDADTKGPLRDIHRRVGTAILFESSGGQTEKVAHLPELRFALGEPDVDTTSVDTAAFALEDKAYYIRRAGSDGFKIGHQPTLKKVVSDRRASLDEESEIRPAMRKLVEDEFRRGATVPILCFPENGTEVPDSPRLTLVVIEPEREWTDDLRKEIAEWTKRRGESARLYPAALVWCVKKPGRDLREKVEHWLAWKRVEREIADGTLSGEFEPGERSEIREKIEEALAAAKDEVWGGYRYAILADRDGLREIDLGASHSSSNETLCGRVISALKQDALLNESIGAGYIDRNWPPAFELTGAWPLSSLRQSFLNGSLTRLLDPDATLRRKIVEFVAAGEFGLASGQNQEGGYQRIWFQEAIDPDEVQFDASVFLLKKEVARQLKTARDEGVTEHPPTPEPGKPIGPKPPVDPEPDSEPKTEGTQSQRICVIGTIPPEQWNRLGMKLLPKLKTGSDLRIEARFSALVDQNVVKNLKSDLAQILAELGVSDSLRIEEEE
ncbi:MAG: hypothetical protein KatS3mg082_3026 [Nitrospiraceae bacterium]|nr:MAG: hypothetical protein KatS3mg015_1224 [Fimbriimonadales bacterium]GIW56622.1 MAG: hypothetical protein KatS3mg082_3026 [Nitrospiraceae bacterium]